MNKKILPHIMAVVSLVVFITLVQACATPAHIANAASVDELDSLRDKFAWLNAKAESGGNYVLVVNGDERLSKLNLTYRDRTNITITLRGVGGNRTISASQHTGLFSIGDGVTLILDDNITLRGISSGSSANTASLVTIFQGGTLIMNEGSTVTGHGNDGDGGGVYVSTGGTFLMNGGTIIGNFSFYTVGSARQAAQGQALGGAMVGSAVSGLGIPTGSSENSTEPTPPAPPTRRGGGVYVSVGGTFTKTGGTIAGFENQPSISNAVIDPAARPISDSGHAVFAAIGTSRGIGPLAAITITGTKRKERTAGPNDNLHIGSDGTFSGAWDF